MLAACGRQAIGYSFWVETSTANRARFYLKYSVSRGVDVRRDCRAVLL